MPMNIQALLSGYLTGLQQIYKSHLKSVILYGSYARGDYTVDSDIDIMILVDLPDEGMDKYSDALAEVGFEYNVTYGIWVMPVVKNREHFKYWVQAYPMKQSDSMDVGTRMDMAMHWMQVAKEDLDMAYFIFNAG